MNSTELQELAASQALGALGRADAERLETAVAHDPDAQAEVAGFKDTAAVLAMALSPPARPSAELRAKILERVRNHPQTKQIAGPAAVPTGFQFVLNNDSGWQSTPIPGLRMKPLSVSRDLGYRVLLAELGPGARFPEHDHDSSEELFIVSGHLQTEGRLLGPGDFLHAEPGTHHHELISPDGCVALLIERAPAVV